LIITIPRRLKTISLTEFENRTMKSAIAITSLLAVGTSAFAPVSQTSGRKATHLADDLFGEKSKSGGKKEMSQALPFAARPKILDGTMAGDVGFE
jgi:hypothetical protein